ncbi:glycosyltransferase family 4 protein [Spirosoma rhododendri]|uniref:Glycosyltransferase family 4 protein n=1 Tax=Spirosoma rhododendri TaxID=2728024 RepID=A0A7L5DIV3_9BACT|nr:glycosyltransferase family 1 protein [Spirosoma rhododendri]QJD77023.1 glycosyltransferase family 4 protein [Spirosoma rhododendri]
MRIGIEAQRLFRANKHGMDFVALELIHALQDIDTENDYFIFVRPDIDEQCLRLRGRFTLVKLTALNYIHWEQVVLPLAIRQYRLDVLHCTANTAPFLTGTPLVLTLHDVLFMNRNAEMNTATIYQRLGNVYRTFLVPWLIRRGQPVITVSHFASSQIKEELRLPDARISVLYNGVSPKFLVPSEEEQHLQARLRYKLPARYFLFLGSADPRKNMINVLRAYLAYRNRDTTISLVVSGKNPAFLRQHFTPDECGQIQAHCHFIGYIHDEDLPSLYAMADVFLFPSISEGFGLPIIEAMASGTPVITGNRTAMPEVAGSAALLVDPHRPQAITDAMHQLTTNALLRQNLIRRGQAWATRFSWPETAQQLLTVYRQFDPAQTQPARHAQTTPFL